MKFTAAPQTPAATATATATRSVDFEVLKQLVAVIWPEDRPDVRNRVLAALSFLCLSKAFTMSVSRSGVDEHDLVPRSFPPAAQSLALKLFLSFFFVGSWCVVSQGPILFKYAVDGLATGAVTPLPLVGLALTPIACLWLYGLARAATHFCTEMRSFVFASVTQEAIRQVAGKVMHH